MCVGAMREEGEKAQGILLEGEGWVLLHPKGFKG